MSQQEGMWGCGPDSRTYVCLAELTAGQRRWSEQVRRCQERHRHYAKLTSKGAEMRTEITDGSGVTMAGPDSPALAVAEAKAQDGFATELVVGRAILGGASVGRVAPAQAGILPTGPMPITEEMVRRARAAALGLGLEPHHIRSILEAALHG
jgi:acetyl-CoA carboxylase carboxyltransferase component